MTRPNSRRSVISYVNHGLGLKYRRRRCTLRNQHRSGDYVNDCSKYVFGIDLNLGIRASRSYAAYAGERSSNRCRSVAGLLKANILPVINAETQLERRGNKHIPRNVAAQAVLTYCADGADHRDSDNQQRIGDS
jgi:hypothetical protein